MVYNYILAHVCIKNFFVFTVNFEQIISAHFLLRKLNKYVLSVKKKTTK